MQVQLLGPVEASDNGQRLALGATKQRALLAMLALRANRAVSAETLVDGLWGDDPPASAAKMIQHHVSRLRKVLPPGAEIVTRGRGYELRIAPDDVDAVRFERLVSDGAWRAALELWRGAPLADLADEPFAAAEIRRLEELRRTALEDAIEAELAAGRHNGVISTVTAALAEHPVSERLHGHLMLALYRAGRQADALEAYRRARAVLVEQAGVEPGADLRRLHAAILRQDPALEAPSEALPPLETVPCPFKGLAAYEVADSAWFFGRERLVAELVGRLLGSPLLALVGPSGSGKSSVLGAGLLAELARGVLPGSEGWRQVVMRPGEHPARALTAVAGGSGPPGVLVVDQFEEAFTLCRDALERAAFIETLLACAGDRSRWAAAVVAIRADYYGRCAEHPPLARLVSANHVLIGPMGRDELRRAIELPAQRAGLELGPGLVERLLDDARDVPGALPLVSSALVALWQHRDGRTLRLAEYGASGGLRGAVARLAEQAYLGLDPPAQDAARRTLLRLVGDDGQGRPVRRRVSLTEVQGAALDALTAARLVVVDAGEAELAHDALLREWPRLRGWLEEDADSRRLHARLAQAAREWQESGRDRGELYRGPRLAAALEWRARHPDEAGGVEDAFLDASVAADERARRRLHIALATAVALLALTTAAALVAATQRARARDEARAADAQHLGAQALIGGPLDRAMLFARQAVALDDTPTTRADLLAALQRSPAAIRVLVPANGVSLTALVLSPDGATLAAGDDEGTLAFVDAGTSRRLRPRYRAGANAIVASLAYSPDGRRLAVGGGDADGAFAAELDARTLRHTHQWRPRGGFVAAVRFSPDSRVLAAEVVQRPQQAQLIRWNARNGGQLGIGPEIPGHDPSLVALTGPDRALVSSAGDRGSVLRDAGSGRALRRFAAAAPVTAAEPAGRLAAFGSAAGAVRLLDTRSGRVRRLRQMHTGGITAMCFSRDGGRLLTAGRDARLVLWHVHRATPLEVLRTDGSGTLTALALAADGRTAYSAGRDGRVTEWDLTGRRGFLQAFATGPSALVPGTLSVARRAPRFAAVDEQGAIDVFALGSLRLLRRLRAPGVDFDDVALTPDGRTAAATTEDGWMWFWDVGTGRRRHPPEPAHGTAAWVVTADGRGRWLASGGFDDVVRIWDARSGVSVRTALPGSAGDLSLSPDGRTLAVTFANRNFAGGLGLRSVPGLRPLRTLPLPAGTSGRFSADGRTLLYGDQRGRLWIIDTRNWRVPGRPLATDGGRIVDTALSPDGRSVAVTSGDGTGTLWDVTSPQPLGAPLPGGPEDVVGAAFVDGGKRLLVLRRHGGALWDPRPQSWIRRACAIAGRTLTRAEWRHELADRPFAPACVK